MMCRQQEEEKEAEPECAGFKLQVSLRQALHRSA